MEERALKNISDEIDSCCPWLEEVRILNKTTWEKIGKALRSNQADRFNLRLWALVKEIIEEEGSQTLDRVENTQESDGIT